MVPGNISVVANLINAGAATREFTNTVHNLTSWANKEFRGRPSKPLVNLFQRPLGFAKSIERHA